MKLSKNEAKFRKRFIAEYHYRKYEQRIFDDAIKELKTTYKEIYKSVKIGNLYMFMVAIEVSRTTNAMSNAMRRAALSVNEAITAMLNLQQELSSMSTLPEPPKGD